MASFKRCDFCKAEMPARENRQEGTTRNMYPSPKVVIMLFKDGTKDQELDCCRDCWYKAIRECFPVLKEPVGIDPLPA